MIDENSDSAASGSGGQPPPVNEIHAISETTIPDDDEWVFGGITEVGSTTITPPRTDYIYHLDTRGGERQVMMDCGSTVTCCGMEHFKEVQVERVLVSFGHMWAENDLSL
eukprot:4747095-Amphidinium_carterae.1